MQTLENLKRSISSAVSIHSVVRTMKTMAAVSIRQYEEATESLKVYYRTVETGLRMLVSKGATPSSTRQKATGISDSDVVASGTAVRSPGITGAIIFGSDLGMCGQFNEQIVQRAIEQLLDPGTMATGVAPSLCVGHRVADNLQANNVTVDKTFSVPGSASGITELVQDLLAAIDKWRDRYRVRRILVFHNRRLSASSWRPHFVQLLPIPLERIVESSGETDDGQTTKSRSLPLWTMETNVLFSRLVKQFLFVSLFQACAESLAGENASRIAAMQAAERNIKDRLHELRSVYAQRRQTAITEELLDVVTGFEALK